MTSFSRARHLLLLPAYGLLITLPLAAATYFPMSDADLVKSSQVVALAEVVDRTTRLGPVGSKELPFTVVTLRRLEVFQGDVDETFGLVVPGGIVGDAIWAVPGAPVFQQSQLVVVMVNALPGQAGEYGLSEFGLSKFDLASDESGRRFAVRPVFGPEEDLRLSRQDHLLVPGAAAAAPARDAESFLAALRGLRHGGSLETVAYARPTSELDMIRGGVRQKFANLGGVEPGNCGGQNCLFRWFWDIGASPSATIFTTGSQTRLVSNTGFCGVDQACLVDYMADQWHGVAGTDIRISGPGTPGNLEVIFDAATPHNGNAWSTPYTCDGQGVIGIGGPSTQGGGGARTYRGISPYYAATGGTVSMRPWACDYETSTFTEVLMHEVGHVLGLSHPNQLQSIHTTTSSSQWDQAVMASRAHTPSNVTPQADDIQGMQFYYGTAAPGPAPVANFTSSNLPTAGTPVTFTDTSTNSPSGWIWFFGEPSSGSNVSRSQNPTHTYAAAGTYTVDMYAGNLNGGSRVTKTVTVAPGAVACTPSPTTLCLNGNRFAVTANFRTLQGQSGAATGVELTADSGYFYFFNAANIEIVIKVLNACSINQSYWVFAAGLTNVEVDLQVVDTRNGTLKTYHNPLETPFAPVQDTSAFATCP
jgi:PKD repeat protein